MKHLFAALAMLLSPFIYGQETLESTIGETITFKPQEVFASGVLFMDLNNPTDVKYLISKGSTVLIEKNIIDAKGSVEEKIDLSALQNGEYSIRIFIESNEVKKIFFKKS